MATKTKKEREQQREHARLLYMQGEPQKSIAEKVGVSAQTVTKWVAEGGWEQARAAANITRPELVNKILNSINVLLEDLANDPSPEKTAASADKLVNELRPECHPGTAQNHKPLSRPFHL